MKNIIQQIFGSTLAKKSHSQFAWVDDIADMDDLVALKFCHQHLAIIVGHMQTDEDFDFKAALNLLIHLEDLNFERLEKLSAQFVHVENLKPELEINISETCYNYCRQSYIAHLKVIEKVSNPSKFKLDGNMPIIVIARAVYTATHMMKWRMYTQANPPTKMWLQLFMLYRIASQQLLLTLPIALFKQTPLTTLSAYFIQLFMLGNLVQENLHKQQVDVACRVLKNWLTRAHISKHYTPEQYLFFVDLEQDLPAKRMRNFEPNEQCRYWELDELEKQIRVGITVTDRGEMPESLLGAKIDNVNKLNDTLNIMLSDWTKTDYVRQRRKEPRYATSKNAKVTAGIANICNQVHQANQVINGLQKTKDAKSFEERMQTRIPLTQLGSISINSASLDTWIITDESPHGLGTRVNKYANILARPDKLIGLMIDEDPNQLIIGIIRSVKPTAGNQLKVGIEIMSQHPVWVQMRQLSSQEIFSDTVATLSDVPDELRMDAGLFAGIYMPIEAGISSVSSLLIPKSHYRPNSSYAVSIADSYKRALLGAPIESRDDWVKVAFPF